MTMELDADLVLHWYSKFDASGLVRIRSKESQEMLSSLVLEKRKKKKGSGSSANNTDSAAVGFVTPSRALQASALGLGVIEIIRLWG